MSFSLRCLFLVALTVVSVGSQPPELVDPEPPVDLDPYPPPYITEHTNGPFPEADGEILLLEWIPFPINKYRYIVQNLTSGYVCEQGETRVDYLTKNNFPLVRFALACVPGDGEYIFLDDIPLLTVDFFRDDRFFEEYQDTLYTFHGFPDKISLWAHFLAYPQAFQPVINKLSYAYMAYMDTIEKKDEAPQNVEEALEDFDGHGVLPKPDREPVNENGTDGPGPEVANDIDT